MLHIRIDCACGWASFSNGGAAGYTTIFEFLAWSGAQHYLIHQPLPCFLSRPSKIIYLTLRRNPMHQHLINFVKLLPRLLVVYSLFHQSGKQGSIKQSAIRSWATPEMKPLNCSNMTFQPPDADCTILHPSADIFTYIDVVSNIQKP